MHIYSCCQQLSHTCIMNEQHLDRCSCGYRHLKLAVTDGGWASPRDMSGMCASPAANAAVSILKVKPPAQSSQQLAVVRHANSEHPAPEHPAPQRCTQLY